MSEPASDSKTLCVLPWMHLNVKSGGQVRPCCHAQSPHGVAGDLRLGTLREIWNSEAMRRLRRDMLAGRQNAACARCHLHEASGVPSPRHGANKAYRHLIPLVHGTAADGSVKDMRLAYWDIEFSNLCNFRCRTCNAFMSSAWHSDALALGLAPSEFKPGDAVSDPSILWQRLPREPLRENRALDQLLPRLNEVEEIRMEGGEPLLSDQHLVLLDSLIAAKRFDVKLVYNTNLSVTEFRGRDILGLWDRFQSVQVFASLDGTGRRGEYLRTGLDWASALRNRERMRSACPRAKFAVQMTASAFNLLHIPEMHRELVDDGIIGVHDIYVNNLLNPSFLRTQILPAEMKIRAAALFEDHLRSFVRPRSGDRDWAERCLRGAVRFMKAADGSAELSRFRRYARDLDRVRGECITETLPELAELLREPAEGAPPLHA